jgi:hypothetical protein
MSFGSSKCAVAHGFKRPPEVAVWKQARAHQEISPIRQLALAFLLDSAAHRDELHTREGNKKERYHV